MSRKRFRGPSKGGVSIVSTMTPGKARFLERRLQDHLSEKKTQKEKFDQKVESWRENLPADKLIKKKVITMSKEAFDKIAEGLKEALEITRNSSPQKIAEDIVSVQPMNGCLDDIFRGLKSEEELIKEGYVPLDPTTKMMWVKR